jgi:cell division protein FtsL
MQKVEEAKKEREQVQQRAQALAGQLEQKAQESLSFSAQVLLLLLRMPVLLPLLVHIQLTCLQLEEVKKQTQQEIQSLSAQVSHSPLLVSLCSNSS